MTTEQITVNFKEILKPYAQDQEALENLSNETDFVNDLKINSANIVDIFLDTEDKFDIVFDNESLEQIQDVGDAVEAISKKISGQESA